MSVQILKSVALFAGANALAAAMPLLLLPILTRALSPTDYGLVAMYSLVITAFGALIGLSAHGAVGMRYFDRSEIDFPRYVGNSLLILLATGACLFAVLLVAGEAIEEITKLPQKWLFIAAGVSALQFVLLIRLAIFQSAKSAGYFAVFRISQAVLDAVLSVVLVLGFALTWEGRLVGQSLAIALLGTAAAVSLWARGWVKIEPDRKYISNALEFGLPLIPHVVGGMLLVFVDRILIANILGVAQTGIYMVAVQIGLGIYLIADACNRAISPWLIEALKTQDPARDKRIVRYTVIYFLFLMISSLLFGFSVKWVLPLIVGPAFASAAHLIWLLAAAQAFSGMYLVVSNIIFYKNKTASLSVITISCGFLNVALSYILLRWFGLIGAAAAQLVSQIAMFVAAFGLAQRLRPLPWVTAVLPVHIQK